MTFVPDTFRPPDGLDAGPFRLRPLDVEHNRSDYAAWSSSIDHIRATPGFAGRGWPRRMTIEENERDLAGHAKDFAGRTGFTYAVLEPERDEVIGCVYIYPSREPGADAVVTSWVRADRANLDGTLAGLVNEWVRTAWPFERPAFPGRDLPGRE